MQGTNTVLSVTVYLTIFLVLTLKHTTIITCCSPNLKKLKGRLHFNTPLHKLVLFLVFKVYCSDGISLKMETSIFFYTCSCIWVEPLSVSQLTTFLVQIWPCFNPFNAGNEFIWKAFATIKEPGQPTQNVSTDQALCCWLLFSCFYSEIPYKNNG